MTKILVVDSNANTGFRIKKIFENYQIKFSMASSSSEAISKLHKQFDMIIVDINLGSEDGFDVIQKIHENNSSALVVIVTSTNTRKAFVRGIRLGAVDYILKPFEDTYIKGKILKHIKDTETPSPKSPAAIESIIYKHIEKSVKSKNDLLVGMVVVYSVANPTQIVVKSPIVKGFFSRLDKAVYASELTNDSTKYIGETIDTGINGKLIILDALKLSEKENVVSEVKKMAVEMLENSDFGFEMEFLSLPHELRPDERVLETLTRKIEENINNII